MVMSATLVTNNRVAARIRMPLLALGVVTLVAGLLISVPGWWRAASLALVFIGFALYFRLGTPDGKPVDVVPPVRGQWLAMNSPTSRVPSHHLHGWAQTYAIDLVADPPTGARPGVGWWPVARRPEDFPGFGRPVAAPIDGTVVHRVDAMRDHWSRTSPLAMLYFIVESVRELIGPVGVLGNHVVVQRDDGACVLLAHLKHHSVRVKSGERVRAGEVVGACGNSGNSTEPHVHIQAMDRPSTWIAAGLPLCFDGTSPPENGAHLNPA